MSASCSLRGECLQRSSDVATSFRALSGPQDRPEIMNLTTCNHVAADRAKVCQSIPHIPQNSNQRLNGRIDMMAATKDAMQVPDFEILNIHDLAEPSSKWQFNHVTKIL